MYNDFSTLSARIFVIKNPLKGPGWGKVMAEADAKKEAERKARRERNSQEE